MERVSIQFTGEQIVALRGRARAGHRSVAAVVREAVDAYLAADPRAALIERAMASLDGFPGGPADLAENHDLYMDSIRISGWLD